MIQGLYTAAGGMIALEKRQDIIANNLANVSTAGFKKHKAVQLGFDGMFSSKFRHPFHYNVEAAPAGGVKSVESWSDTAMGSLKRTDNPLNLALQGPGYFSVDTPRGVRYTRSGDFTIDIDGHLATTEGFKVMSTEGQPIDVRGERVNVGREGIVNVDGIFSGRIQLTEFRAPQRLLREGANLYAASEAVSEASAESADTTVTQSYLEMSNVNVVSQMTEMVMGIRNYEANQKVIQTHDALTGMLIERIGMQ
jgi:flagellar basal-body rod protein FlgF